MGNPAETGMPSRFVNMLRSFHSDMRAWVSVGGEVSAPFFVNNGVKQGDVPAPTLFAVYFAVVLNVAFKSCNHGVYVRYRTSGSVFNIRRFAARTKIFTILVRDLLYADDCALVAHTEEDMQQIMNSFSAACTAFGLTINLKKTVVMFQPPPTQHYLEPNIFVYGKRLNVVGEFVYLGSAVNRHGNIDSDIPLRIQKASAAFGKLENRLWKRREVNVKTKLDVYNACVLTTLLYGCETWVTYRHNFKRL